MAESRRETASQLPGGNLTRECVRQGDGRREESALHMPRRQEETGLEDTSQKSEFNFNDDLFPECDERKNGHQTKAQKKED